RPAFLLAVGISHEHKANGARSGFIFQRCRFFRARWTEECEAFFTNRQKCAFTQRYTLPRVKRSAVECDSGIIGEAKERPVAQITNNERSQIRPAFRRSESGVFRASDQCATRVNFNGFAGLHVLNVIVHSPSPSGVVCALYIILRGLAKLR